MLDVRIEPLNRLIAFEESRLMDAFSASKMLVAVIFKVVTANQLSFSIDGSPRSSLPSDGTLTSQYSPLCLAALRMFSFHTY